MGRGRGRKERGGEGRKGGGEGKERRGGKGRGRDGPLETFNYHINQDPITDPFINNQPTYERH